MPALPQIAPKAGTHDVLPRVRSTKMPRDHVIDRQLTRTHPTVLARVVVAHKHLTASDPHGNPRAPNVVPQPDHPRPRTRPARASDERPPRRKHLGLLGIEKCDGAAKATHIEWLEVNVQDKYPVDRVVTSARA